MADDKPSAPETLPTDEAPHQSYAELLAALGVEDAPPSYTHIPPNLSPNRHFSVPPEHPLQPRHQPPSRPEKHYFPVDDSKVWHPSPAPASPGVVRTPPSARPLSYYGGSPTAPGRRLYPDPNPLSTPSYDGEVPSTTNYSKLNFVDEAKEPVPVVKSSSYSESPTDYSKLNFIDREPAKKSSSFYDSPSVSLQKHARPASFYDPPLHPHQPSRPKSVYESPDIKAVPSTSNWSKLDIKDEEGYTEPRSRISSSSSSNSEEQHRPLATTSANYYSAEPSVPVQPAPLPPVSVSQVPSGAIAMTVFTPSTPETTKSPSFDHKNELDPDPAPKAGESSLPFYEDSKDDGVYHESCCRKRCRHKCDIVLAILIIMLLFAMGSAGTGIYSILKRDCWLLYPTSYSGSSVDGACVDADLPTLYTGYIMMGGTSCMLFCVVLLLVMLIFTCWKRCFRFISCSCALIAVIALGGAAVFAGIYTLSFPFINESFDIEWYYWLVVASAGCSLPVFIGSVYLYFENTCCRDC